MGGRGASFGAHSSAKAEAEEKTADMSVESAFREHEIYSAKSRVLGWNEEDWGGKAIYNKATKIKKDESDLYAKMESLRADLSTRKVTKISSEADREKYFKQLGKDQKAAQDIINKANTLYSKWGDIQRTGKLMQYTDRDVDDYRHALSRIMDTASAIKRKINDEGMKYRVFFGNDGKFVKYPDYKSRTK